MRYAEVPQKQFSPLAQAVSLRCGYADFIILNPQDWDTARADRVIERVELVFTKYPVDTARWIKPFTQLMTFRVRSLMKLIPSTEKNANAINWRLVAQTDAKDRVGAESLFHGFIIHYRVEPPEDLPQVRWSVATRVDLAMQDVRQALAGRRVAPDTVIQAVLRRHPEWQARTVVMDWTASMYPFGAELLGAIHHGGRKGLARHLIVFNDGDDYRRQAPKRMGQTGGLYTTDPTDLQELLTTLETAVTLGDGAEPEENNLEALIAAQRLYPGTEPLLLIADTKGHIRDLELLPRLKRPVDIILCDTPRHGIDSDYLTLAWATGGTLHTVRGEYRFGPAGEPPEDPVITLDGCSFKWEQGRFYRTLCE